MLRMLWDTGMACKYMRESDFPTFARFHHLLVQFFTWKLTLSHFWYPFAKYGTMKNGKQRTKTKSKTLDCALRQWFSMRQDTGHLFKFY